MDIAVRSIILGVLATVAIDIWATFANKMLKFPRTNWAMVGRWLGNIPQGKFKHNPISAAPQIRNEDLLGWVFHYLIGLTYAFFYVLFVYLVLDNVPTLLSAWLFGLFTILSPWLIMQPALGLGTCASKAAQPNLVRLQNIIIHSIFGVTLYFGWLGIEYII